MAKEFAPVVTLTTSLLPIQRANEFTLRQPASYSDALNTPPASFAVQPGFHLIETSSMSDPVHQLTACSNTPTSDLVAATFEEIRDAPAAVNVAVPANLHAFHHASTPHQAIAELHSSVLASEKVTAAACRLMNARTPELLSYTPTILPSKVGREAQPAKINAWSRITTGGREYELQGYLMYMAGLTNQKIHHINWCGKAVFGRTATPPAVSLCIIVAPPKKEYFDFQINLCTSVLLHNALRLVDPILFTGDFNVLNSCSGTTLQNAVIGSCHKFYNERGCWSLDELEADEDIPVLDTMNVHEYGTGDTILNGWFGTRNVPVRSDLSSHSAELAKKYHAARKPAMEETACDNGEGMQKRVLRQPFVKSLLRRVVHCSQIDDTYFSATMTAAAASRRPQVKPAAQRSLDGDELATTSGSTREVTRRSVIATKREDRLPRTGDPELAKLLEVPGETSYDKQSGSATETSVFKHKMQSWKPDSDTASRVYFNSGSASGAAADAISIAASPPSVDGVVTMLDVKRPVLSLAEEIGTGRETLSAEHNSEANTYSCLSATRSVSNETQQPVSENIAAATLALDCAFAAELDLPGLIEPRSPLPMFKRTRPSARQASWTSFRSKVRNVLFRDRRPPGLERRLKAIKGLFSRKQNILR